MSTKVLLKKSSVVGKTPNSADLSYGEVALNYADGKLYYKDSSNNIKSFTEDSSVVTLAGTQSLSNKTLVNPLIEGKITSKSNGGDEGGEILLEKAQTNTTLSGTGITIDVYQNKLRIFEQGGSARGVYIDLSAAAAGVGTNLITGSSSGTGPDADTLDGFDSSYFLNYNNLNNKPTLFSGSYTDLTNKPTLFSGSYNDLTNKPTLFSGSYTDLTNRPNLATVATTGSYNDLTNKPTINSGTVTSITAGSGLTGGTITNTGSIAIDTSIVATLTGTQTLTNKTLASPTLTGILNSTDTTESTSSTTGAIKTAGGIAAAKNITTGGSFNLSTNASIQYNSVTESIDFIFA